MISYAPHNFQWLNLFLPFSCRLFKINFPALLPFLAKNPLRRFRTRWLGSYVSRGPFRTCSARKIGEALMRVIIFSMAAAITGIGRFLPPKGSMVWTTDRGPVANDENVRWLHQCQPAYAELVYKHTF